MNPARTNTAKPHPFSQSHQSPETGWHTQTFDDLIRAGTLTLSDGYRAKLEELGGDGPIFLRAGHVSDSHIEFAGIERFHLQFESRVRGKMSQAGDVVITTKGNSTGRVAYVSESHPQFVYSPHLSYWRSLKHTSLFPGFLRYWSRGREFQEQLRGMASSTDMAPYLSLVDQRRLRITLPPIPEQRAIASVLGALDDKIELNRRMNETLGALVQTLFNSWFVDATANGLPKGWRKGKLGEHVEVTKGLSYKGSGLADEGIPLHNLNSVYEGGRYKHEGLKHYTGEYKDRHVIYPGDVIVANTEQGHDYLLIGFPAIVPKCYGKFGLFTHHIYRVRPLPNSRLTNHFIYLTLLSPNVREQVIGHTNGTTVKVIDIFDAAGLKRPDISILSDEFLAEVQHLPQRNLAVELLQKLLNNELKIRSQKYLVQSRSFADMLEATIRKYQNRTIEAAQVIVELIDLARKMREGQKRGEKLGLTDDEVAFYDALEVNDSAVKVLGEPTLKDIARELVSHVRKSVTIDWTLREAAQAQIRVLVRRILRKYGYPPDKQEKATQTVLEQAKLLCADWAEK